MNIGIMGAPVDNGNLGCVALTYSLILALHEIEKKHNLDFTYIIFDWKYNKQKCDEMAIQLGINPCHIKHGYYALLSDPLRIAKHILNIRQMISKIKQCDCIIDLTEGDSFSDIYGDVLFKGRTNVKILIEKLGIPLLMGPQTYGPYLSEKNKTKAVKAIGMADMVIARDNMSLELIKSISSKDVVYTTDLAFLLPYDVTEEKRSNKICVGLNVSDLLYGEGKEVRERKFQLKTDYKRCIHEVIEAMLISEKYKVYLIPHVRADDKAHRILKDRYPELHRIEPFSNPVKAKSFISTMDVFVGARMHGTIAAFTSGVACIPMAYSMKFIGLFSSVGYECCVDLQSLKTENAISCTLSYIEKYQTLAKQVVSCNDNYQKNVELLRDTLERWIIRNSIKKKNL